MALRQKDGSQDQTTEIAEGTEAQHSLSALLRDLCG